MTNTLIRQKESFAIATQGQEDIVPLSDCIAQS